MLYELYTNIYAIYLVISKNISIFADINTLNIQQ